MNTRKTKRDVKEVVKVDDAEMEIENQPISELPLELLATILDWVKNAEDERKGKNKQLANLRLVCSLWRDVIDEHLDYEPAISDKLVTGKFQLGHVCAKKCVITGFTETLKICQIPKFCNPFLITEVSFGEYVSKDAFLVMAKYFSKIGNVKSVKIAQGFLNCNGVDLVASNSNDGLIFNQFVARMENLDIKIPFFDLMIKGWKKDRSLIDILKGGSIPMLKSLKITAHSRLLNTQLPISFLSRHPNLESVHLSLEPFYLHLIQSLFLEESELAEIEKDYWNPSTNQIRLEDYAKIQLKNITIEGPTMCHIVRNTWMPLILAQKKLAQLKLSHIVQTLPVDKSVMGSMPFVDFIPLLKRNMNSLTCLELLKFQFDEIIDFEIFQGLNQLKTLKLQKNNDGLVSRIFNMTSLPGSLEKLSINGFGCSNIQLKHFAKASHLNKLWDIELVSIRHWFCNQPRPIPEDVITAFCEKKSLFYLHLDTLTVNRARIGLNTELKGKTSYFVTYEGRAVAMQENFKSINLYNFTLNCKDFKRAKWLDYANFYENAV